MGEPTDFFNALPQEYKNVLRMAQDKFNIEVILLQELKGGRTGAYLFLVSVSMLQSNKVQHLILKLDHKNPKSKKDELERHGNALKLSPPEFAKNHFADLAFERIELNDAIAIFYSIAGQSLHSYKTLSSYQHQSKLEKIFSRTNQLSLAEWKREPKFERAVHPQRIIADWLGYRLKEGGNIEQFMEVTCNIPHETPGLMIQGDIFPNPLLFSRKAELWTKAPRAIDIVTGFQHGDLNIGNILARFDENSNEITGYYLIDFALFEDSMPLFYDLHYLEMSYLIQELSRVSIHKWANMISRFAKEDIIDPSQVPIELSGACAVINAGRKAFDKWVLDHYPSLSDDLWGQYWLAAAAAGLNYCNKAVIQEKERLAGLIFAAVHLKRYHSVFGLPLPVEVKYLNISDRSDEFQTSGIEVQYNKKPKHNLPAQTTAFIGRQKELETVTRLLQRDDVRLVTLTGPGGTGKTRLALESAGKLTDNFKDGIYFIDLAPLREPDSVPASVAGSLGLRETGSRPTIEELKTKLKFKELLLLLDNFEQVTAAAPQLGELLQHCPELKLLVTSREALHLRGEHVLPVPPLGLPQGDFKQLTSEQLTQFEAIRLFAERAAAVKPDFEITGDNVKAVAEICIRLDGLPLAIELAAARTNLFSPKDLLVRIEARLQILRGGAKDLPDRQKTLRDTINWSYEMLKSGERQLFSLFSVFSGCTFEALEKMAEKIYESNKMEIDVLDGTTSLVDKSLIRKADGNTGESRLFMLETIREYAAEKLNSYPDLALSTQKAHAEYFASIAQQLKKELTGFQRESALNKAEPEVENLKAAWRYWVAKKNIEQLNKMTECLWLIFDAKGWYYSTLDLTADLLNVLSSRPSSPGRALQEIMLQTSLARVLMSIKGCTPEVEKAYTHALDLCNKYGEIPQSFPVLRALAGFYGYIADFKKSAHYAKQILKLAEESNNPSLKIEGMLVYGYSIVFAGTPMEGIEYLEKVIAEYKVDQHGSHSFRTGNNPGVTACTTSALCLWMLGFPDRALKLADESISLANKLKHPFSMAYAYFHTGLLHLWRQEYATALERANSALKVAEEHEFQIWKAVAFCLHGAALSAMGQTAKGLIEINLGIDMYTELKTPPVFWPILLTLQAGGYIQSGQLMEGLNLMDEALNTMGEETGNPVLPELYRLKGEVLMMVSPENDAAAVRLFTKAHEIARRQQTRMFELRSAVSLNRLCRKQGSADQCRQLLNEAINKFTEGFNTADLKEAQKLLAEK